MSRRIFLFTCLWLLGCQEVVNITLKNADADHPVFEINSASALGGKGSAIPNFSVLRWDEKATTPEAMWRIESKTGRRIKVEEIVYGITPEGFREVTAPKTLEPNQRYEALSIEPGFVGSLGFTLTR